VVCNAATFETVREAAVCQGLCAAPDDCWLTLRGLRTLDVRLRRHADTALKLAQWLAEQPEVEAVLHPALPAHPGHALWRRDFNGSSGLFAAVLRPVDNTRLEAMVNGFHRFGMGFSWGGYESLALPMPAAYVRSIRTATRWPYQGPLLRLHAGLDDADALISELHSGFQRLRARTPDR
jgi:cysteine-S-conjugate beta-lyase